MAKKAKKAQKEKKPKKAKKVKEIDPLKAAKVHGMRFSGARARKPAINAYTGLAAGIVLVVGVATGYAYLQGKKIAPGGGNPALAPFNVHSETGAFRPGG